MLDIAAAYDRNLAYKILKLRMALIRGGCDENCVEYINKIKDSIVEIPNEYEKILSRRRSLGFHSESYEEECREEEEGYFLIKDKEIIDYLNKKHIITQEASPKIKEFLKDLQNYIYNNLQKMEV